MRLATILALAFVAVGSLPARGADPDLPVFTDVTAEAGIRFKHSFGDFELSNIVEGTGAGAMFLDYDSDGLLDIYFVNGCWLKDVSDNRGRTLRGNLANALYRNKGDGTFEDVTAKAGVGDTGYGVGCSAADYDGDGDLDIYVCNYGPNVLYRNNGDGTFTDVSKVSGLADSSWSLSACWFDYDGDGDLDVYVANYLEYDQGKFRSYYAAAGYPGPLSYHGQPDALYRNNGDGTFTDVTTEAGVYNPEGRAMSATVADLDNDGRLDIYVTNDAMENCWWRNLGNGKFANMALAVGLAFGEGGQGVSSMGPTVGDVDRDGRIDIYVPDMGYGCLLMNRGEYFEDRTAQARLAVVCGQYTGWGGALFDYDNDGYLDIFVANGNAHHEYPEEDVLMRNDGKGLFTDVARFSGPYFREKHVGRGATYGDFDNDGDLDLLVANLNDKPKLLRNDGGNRRHWLTVVTRLANGKSDAIGARVIVRVKDLVQIHDLVPMTGYLSQVDPRPHFGLGKADQADSVEIHWPDGRRTRLTDVRANQFLKVVQDPK
ncbi:MAG: CRTAC1 family protein [Acidobacteria bacterium]|nr:CRTAC1 family protein [Planctomycetota bacterium]MBE3135270.1 CRTAC1 family protein [Acidobacteriota bacterium]